MAGENPYAPPEAKLADAPAGPGSAIKVYEGAQRYYTSNAPNRLYYWVQACNAAGCSTLSAYKIADPFPGCL